MTNDQFSRSRLGDALSLRRSARRAVLAALSAVALLAIAFHNQLASAQMATAAGAKITEGNQTSIPEGFREWVFLGAPLTPNGLNDAFLMGHQVNHQSPRLVRKRRLPVVLRGGLADLSTGTARASGRAFPAGPGVRAARPGRGVRRVNPPPPNRREYRRVRDDCHRSRGGACGSLMPGATRSGRIDRPHDLRGRGRRIIDPGSRGGNGDMIG